MADRYSRQIALSEIGEAGQDKLARARVGIVGCGGLGAVAAAYLAGAGVGYLRLIDGDRVDTSNLHRQVFYATDEARPKAEALREYLEKLNPEITVESRPVFLDRRTAETELTELDLVLECTDQAFVKHLVSDFCALQNLPLVYGAVHRFQGYVALFANATQTDCHLRDLFPEPDNRLPTCAEVGVLNTAAGTIGMLQANEALKWLLAIGEGLNNRLLTIDLLTYRQQIIGLAKSWSGSLTACWAAGAYGQQTSAAPIIDKATLDSWKPSAYTLFSLLPAVQEPDPLPGAIRFSAGELKRKGRLVFYCKLGRQSLAVAKQLRAKGIEAYSLEGGREGLAKDER